MHSFKKYLSNTFWLLNERILRMIITLLVMIYVARYLGPELFGLLSYVINFVGIFVLIATLGLDNIVVRELVKKPSHKYLILGSAFYLKIAGTLLMWLILVSILTIFSNTRQANLMIAIVSFAVIFQAFNVIDYNFQADVDSKYVTFAQLIQLFISSIIKVFLVYAQAPLIWIALVYCIDALVLAIGLAYFYNQKYNWHWSWHWPTAKKLLADSWPLIISGVVITINMKVDQIMLKEIASLKEVGVYAASVSLSQGFYMIPMILVRSFYPKFISLYENKNKFYIFVQNFSSLLIIFAICLSLLTNLYSEKIIDVLYGDSFSESALILNIHILTLIIVYMEVAFGRLLLIENKQKIIMSRNICMASINVILNYLLIPSHGAIGAAIASLLSIFFGYYLFLGIFPSTRKIFILQTKAFFLLGLFRLLTNKGCRNEN